MVGNPEVAPKWGSPAGKTGLRAHLGVINRHIGKWPARRGSCSSPPAGTRGCTFLAKQSRGAIDGSGAQGPPR